METDALEGKRVVKILLMRHAESAYNKAKSESKLEGDPSKTQALKFLNNPDIIDAKLSDLGVQQCLNAQSTLASYNSI